MWPPGVFVYGTLRSGGANAALIDAFDHRRAPAVLTGAGLWMWQGLPFALEADGEVVGELVTTTQMAALLAVLDELEGVDRRRGGDSGWYRRRLKVVQADVLAARPQGREVARTDGSPRSTHVC